MDKYSSFMPDKNFQDSLLSIRDVSNLYSNRRIGHLGKIELKYVLDKVNLEMRQGEIFGLTGKNGCGKTTLARCILGLTDYEGEILVCGASSEASPGKKQKKHSHQIQMIFQDPGASLNPVKKIGWLLEEPLVIHKTGNAQERANQVNTMLARVGLDPSCKTRRAHELSGGQKQRVCIGRALMLNPSILIADEAISSLDVSAGAQILNLFRELRESTGLTILFISHNTDAVDYLCDRVMVMNQTPRE